MASTTSRTWRSASRSEIVASSSSVLLSPADMASRAYCSRSTTSVMLPEPVNRLPAPLAWSPEMNVFSARSPSSERTAMSLVSSSTMRALDASTSAWASIELLLGLAQVLFEDRHLLGEPLELVLDLGDLAAGVVDLVGAGTGRSGDPEQPDTDDDGSHPSAAARERQPPTHDGQHPTNCYERVATRDPIATQDSDSFRPAELPGRSLPATTPTRHYSHSPLLPLATTPIRWCRGAWT